MKRLTFCRRFQFSLQCWSYGSQLGNAFVLLPSLLTNRIENSLSVGKNPHQTCIQSSVTTFMMFRLSKTEQLVLFLKRNHCSVSCHSTGVRMNPSDELIYFRISPFWGCCATILLFQFSHLKSVENSSDLFYLQTKQISTS